MILNKPIAFLFVALAVLSFSTLAHSQNYNFEGASAGSILSSESGWSTTDLNQADGVEAEANLFFPTTSGNVGIIGGYWSYDGNLITPSSRTTFLTADVSTLASPNLRFRWTQNVSNTDQDNGQRDRFGWTVRSGETDLLSLMVDPKSLVSGSLNFNKLVVNGYNNGLSGSLLTGDYTPNIATLDRGSSYAFEISLDTSANTWSARVAGGIDTSDSANWSTIIQNATLGLASGSSIDGFAATWQTQSTDPIGAGRNVMAFDNIQISNVPEPSSLALVAVGSLALLALRRRRS
ncbi:MAG: PEP-CTERM sorting domain-containing protein [Verrucomicrobia bacterium]|nr:PEP-CTERM sorting domain-containing protein [Verrucomicrobiota bacterium]